MLMLWVWQLTRPPQGIEASRTLPTTEGDRGPHGLSPHSIYNRRAAVDCSEAVQLTTQDLRQKNHNGWSQVRLVDQSLRAPIRQHPHSAQRLNEGIRRIQTTTSPETGQGRRSKGLLSWVSFWLPRNQPAMEPENTVNSRREAHTAINRVFRLGV